MNYAWLAWDVFALVVLAHFVARSASRGFVRTIVSFLGFMIAAVLAGTFSTALAKLLYDNIVRDALELIVSRQIGAAVTDGAVTTSSVLEFLPQSLRVLAEQPGTLLDFIPQTFWDALEGTGDQLVQSFLGDNSEALAAVLVNNVLQSPVLALLRGISFFIIFSLTVFLVRYLSRALNIVNDIPVVGRFNTLLGGVVGLLQGLMALYLLAVLLQMVIQLTGNGLAWLNRQVIDSTFVYRVFFNY